jgi:hypothetical protein
MRRTTCRVKRAREEWLPRSAGQPQEKSTGEKASKQVITGLEVDELTAVRILDDATWEQRRQCLQELGGPPVLD